MKTYDEEDIRRMHHAIADKMEFAFKKYDHINNRDLYREIWAIIMHLRDLAEGRFVGENEPLMIDKIAQLEQEILELKKKIEKNEK